MSHTPGPWVIEYGHKTGHPRAIKSANGNSVINFRGISRAAQYEGQRNAALMAAAPELLGALEELCMAVVWLADEQEEIPAYVKARALIAKHRPEKQQQSQARSDDSFTDYSRDDEDWFFHPND